MKDVLLIFHFLGLIMGLGTGFAMMFLGIAASKMEEKEAQVFMQRSLVLSNMGKIGLLIMLITGFGLVGDRWELLTGKLYFQLKLVGVALLIALIGIMDMHSRKARSGDAKALQKIANLGRFTLPLGIFILVMAVLLFR